MFDTPAFWVAFGLTFGVAHLLPEAAARTRAGLLIVTSLFVLLSVLGLSPALVGLLLVSVAWILLALPVARARDGISSVRRGLVIVAPVLGTWVLGKQSAGMDFGPLSWLYFVGFSFFLVKAWTLIKDYLDGRFSDLDPVCVTAYFLHFPTYLSGPMHYYVEFEASLARPLRLDFAGWVDAIFRLVLGLLKVRFLAPLLAPLSLNELVAADTLDPASLALGCVGYSFMLYFDFSGYSDMAIATSRMLRVDAPENFNNPYLASNLREFWQRWHISFTRVLTAYIFIPVTRALGPSLGPRRRTISALGTVLTFAFCGYWHGATFNFVLWGLYHAAGLVVFDSYRGWKMARRRGKPKPVHSPPVRLAIRCASVAVTFSFVSIGWIFFVYPMGQLF